MVVDLRSDLSRAAGAPHAHRLPPRRLHQAHTQHPRRSTADLPQPVPDRRRRDRLIVQRPLGNGDALGFGFGLLLFARLPCVGDHPGDQQTLSVPGVRGERVEPVKVVGFRGGLHGGGDLCALRLLHGGPRLDGCINGVVPRPIHLREVHPRRQLQLGRLTA